MTNLKKKVRHVLWVQNYGGILAYTVTRGFFGRESYVVTTGPWCILNSDLVVKQCCIFLVLFVGDNSYIQISLVRSCRLWKKYGAKKKTKKLALND